MYDHYYADSILSIALNRVKAITIIKNDSHIWIFVFIVVAKRKETKTQNSQNKASAEETDENSNA